FPLLALVDQRGDMTIPRRHHGHAAQILCLLPPTGRNNPSTCARRLKPDRQPVWHPRPLRVGPSQMTNLVSSLCADHWRKSVETSEHLNSHPRRTILDSAWWPSGRWSETASPP